MNIASDLFSLSFHEILITHNLDIFTVFHMSLTFFSVFFHPLASPYFSLDVFFLPISNPLILTSVASNLLSNPSVEFSISIFIFLSYRIYF